MSAVPRETLSADELGLGSVPPISRGKMSSEVAVHLRELIFMGRLRPGQRLPLKELADGLGVSTTPVREALLILAKEGLVEAEQYRGFRIQRLSQRDIRDIYELHAVMAGMLVERATVALSDEDLRQLEELDAEIRESVARGMADEVERKNYEFHRLLNRRAADSVLLLRVLRETTRFVPRRFYKEVPGWLEASANDHREILQALRSGDGSRAAELTSAHIRRAGELLIDHLKHFGMW